jgi:phage major head subunit gpT-like protein
MAITAVQSEIIRRNADGSFMKGLQGLPSGVDMKQFATTFNTSGKNAQFGWFGSMPGVIEYTGSKQYRSLNAFTDTVTPKEWELSVAFKEDTFEDDVTGSAASAGGALVQRCNDHLNVRLSTFLENGTAGTSDTAYDGQFFFDDDHHGVTDAAHDNDLTGAAATGTDPTAAEFEAAVGDLLEASRGFVDDQLQPYTADRKRFVVVVPTEFSKVASIVLGPNGSLGGGGGAHPTYNQESGVTGAVWGTPWIDNPNLSGADSVYLLAKPGGGSVGPFVVNMRRAWEFNTWDSTNDRTCADQREVLFTSYARYEVGYGVWQDGLVYIFS